VTYSYKWVTHVYCEIFVHLFNFLFVPKSFSHSLDAFKLKHSLSPGCLFCTGSVMVCVTLKIVRIHDDNMVWKLNSCTQLCHIYFFNETVKTVMVLDKSKTIFTDVLVIILTFAFRRVRAQNELVTHTTNRYVILLWFNRAVCVLFVLHSPLPVLIFIHASLLNGPLIQGV